MSCIKLPEPMIAFLDGELDEAQRAEVQQHVDRCVCRTIEIQTKRDIERRIRAKWLDDEVESALASLEPFERRIIFSFSILEKSDEDGADLKCSVETIESEMVRARRAARLQWNGPVMLNRRPEKSHDMQ